jgi:hypothetical protein
LLLAAQLIMNMGGEMVYILQQRLQAQAISEDKSRKGAWPQRRPRVSLAHRLTFVTATARVAAVLALRPPLRSRSVAPCGNVEFRAAVAALAHAVRRRAVDASLGHLCLTKSVCDVDRWAHICVAW